MKQDITSLLEKEMDRRDFFKHVGVGVVAMTGVAAILKTLNGVGSPQARTVGYGASVYGGVKAPQARK